MDFQFGSISLFLVNHFDFVSVNTVVITEAKIVFLCGFIGQQWWGSNEVQSLVKF